ncbi:MAG: FAD-dependent oxidoreductase [Proteobacteria bacterium]|nr:FAD-dependent oxidoreductase [Pseudomonadota bacterium]
MSKISVIGSGFASLTAVRKLRALTPRDPITLISPRAELHYLPSLIWIPAGLRSGEALRIPINAYLARLNIDHFTGSVTGLSDGGRIVHTDQGDIHNDALLIGSGARFIKKLPGIENALTLCEGIDSAETIRDRLAAMQGGTIAFGFGGNPKEPAAMRGGPMFELLFGTDTLLRKQGRRDRFKLVFFSPAPRPGKRLGEKAVTGLLKEMQKRNIDTHLGYKLKEFTPERVITEGGEVPADLILFMPGMTGPQWLQNSGLALSDGGFIKADAHCKADGAERVYVAGDSGSFPGPDWMPKQAHMADLQAETATTNLIAELNDQIPDARFKTELVCIIDSLNKGILVYRSEKHSFITPQCRTLHWAKLLFEWWYLRKYRG